MWLSSFGIFLFKKGKEFPVLLVKTVVDANNFALLAFYLHDVKDDQNKNDNIRG